MSIYLLTGCAGFIGSNTAEMLLQAGHTVYGVDNRNDAYDVSLKDWRLNRLKRHNRFYFQPVDVTDKSALNTFFHEALQHEGRSEFDACIHLAARAGVRYSVQNPYVYLETNVMGTLNLLELCRETGTLKFTMASSSSVYGNSTEEVFHEDQCTDEPCSPYSASKKAGEVLVYSYRHLFELDCSLLRFFTVYGPAGRPDMSILRFVHAIAERKSIRLYGDGTQERDFTYCEDIARGVILSLKPVGYEIFNLGGKDTYSICDLIEIIARQLGTEPIIHHFPAHPADVQRTHADISKAERILGWKPEWNLAEGIGRTIEWYKENREWVKDLQTLQTE